MTYLAVNKRNASFIQKNVVFEHNPTSDYVSCKMYFQLQFSFIET